ncbi:hypothetical protein VZT92_008173 [Zoarces viviparus]|uniref:Uncharacterized protein n=1 Tax=Zoarces viviparus TaxID=48416 RepID=A0AAW1FME6_ZOAVI
MLHSGYSDEDIHNHLVFECGLQRAASISSIRRFCKDHGLKRQRVTDQQLEAAVLNSIQETGPTYGRKMMTGYLAAAGVTASEGRVGAVLRNIHPPYHQARCQVGATNLNPVPYHAGYVGHKIYIDQNEKLVMFGVTHVLAIDGFSSKIVGQATMPIKNNLTIYDEVYRSAVMEYGMWDQVRVDHGKEFYLTLFMQEKLANHRHNTERPPYRQTPSTKFSPQQCPKKLSTDLLPDASVAADWYEQEVGSLTRVSQFGTNPFHSAQDQEAAEREFALQCPDVSVLLDNAANNLPQPFKDGLKGLIDITRRHCQH